MILASVFGEIKGRIGLNQAPQMRARRTVHYACVGEPLQTILLARRRRVYNAASTLFAPVHALTLLCDRSHVRI